MQIHTSLGKREVPDCMANDSKNMSDIELIETLLEQKISVGLSLLYQC